MTCILIREQTTVTERSLQIRCSSQNDPFLKRPLSHLWTSVRSCISISWAHFEHVFICAKRIRHMPITVAFQAPESVYCTRWNETLQRSSWRMHAAQKWMFLGRRSSNFWLKACAQTQGFELLAFCPLPNQTWCLDVFGRFQALVCKLRYSKEMCALIWYMFMKWPSTQFVHVIHWRVYLFRVAMRDDHAAFWWSFCAKPMEQSLCRLYTHPRIKKKYPGPQVRWDWKGAQRFVERKNMVQFVFRFIAKQSNVRRVCSFNFRRSLFWHHVCYFFEWTDSEHCHIVQGFAGREFKSCRIWRAEQTLI